jgi:hypothetical protein
MESPKTSDDEKMAGSGERADFWRETQNRFLDSTMTTTGRPCLSQAYPQSIEQ